MPGKTLLPSLVALIVALTLATGAASQNAPPGDAPASGGQTVTLNGARLWFKVAGSSIPGEAPLVYLHGGPGYNSYSFENTIGARLERHVQMVYLDERGSGRSERPVNKDYAMGTLIADVEALRVQLGVPQISLMGHSFGGTVALEYAAHYPDRVQKLIIVDAAVDLPMTLAPWQRQIQQRYPAAWSYALASPQGRALQTLRTTRQPSDRCAVTKAAFAVDMVALGRINSLQFRHWQQFHDQAYRRQQDALDARSGLRNTGEMAGAYLGADSDYPCYRFSGGARLSMPVLLIVGRYDGAVGVEPIRALAHALPHARLDVFEDSAHFPYAEQPAKFAHDVSVFLAP